jgi:hypothetical protein
MFDEDIHITQNKVALDDDAEGASLSRQLGKHQSRYAAAFFLGRVRIHESTHKHLGPRRHLRETRPQLVNHPIPTEPEFGLSLRTCNAVEAPHSTRLVWIDRPQARSWVLDEAHQPDVVTRHI